MIMGFIGDIGSGKTASMVREAYIMQQETGKKIISNMHLNSEHLEYQYITYDDFKQMAEDKTVLEDCILLLDELHIWMDARTSMSKKNRIISYFALQTRKVDVDLLYTTQYIIQVDVRIRNLTSILIECSTTKSINKTDVKYTLNVINKRLSNGSIKRLKIVFITNAVYDLYDTREVISI